MQIAHVQIQDGKQIFNLCLGALLFGSSFQHLQVVLACSSISQICTSTNASTHWLWSECCPVICRPVLSKRSLKKKHVRMLIAIESFATILLHQLLLRPVAVLVHVFCSDDSASAEVYANESDWAPFKNLCGHLQEKTPKLPAGFGGGTFFSRS